MDILTFTRISYQINNKRQTYLRRELQPVQLSGSMHVILLHISENQCCCQDDIINRYGIDKATISREVKKLEELGYICRETAPANRRKQQLQLTEAGRAIVNKIGELNRNISDILSQGISDDESQVLLSCVERMAQNCNQFLEQPIH